MTVGQDNHFVLKKEQETIIVRLLEGAFPSYEQIVVKGNGSIIPVNKQQFSMMLKRMSILSSDDYKAAIFNFEKNSINISASNPDIGESKEDMPIEFDGERDLTGFESRKASRADRQDEDRKQSPDQLPRLKSEASREARAARARHGHIRHP